MGKLAVAAGLTVLAGAGAVAHGSSYDNYHRYNLDLFGMWQYGECAEQLAKDEITNPNYSEELEASLRAVGRACGYCATSTALTIEEVDYKVCGDPETLELLYPGGNSDAVVAIFLTTDPPAPTNYLNNAMETYPAACQAYADEIIENMTEMFDEVYNEATSDILVPKAYVRQGTTC